MRGQEFQVRDKKVQKMERGGLVEHNVTKGTAQRISSRPAEVSFRQSGQEAPPVPPEKKRRKKKVQAGPADQQNVQRSQHPDEKNCLDEADRFAGAVAPEIWEPRNAPVSMRDAGDCPVPSGRRHGSAGSVREQRADHRYRLKQRKAAAKEIQGLLPLSSDKYSLIGKNGKDHIFRNEAAPVIDEKKILPAGRKRQTFKNSDGAAQPGADVQMEHGQKLCDLTVHRQTENADRDEENTEEGRPTVKKKYTLKIYADSVMYKHRTDIQKESRKIRESATGNGKLQFIHKKSAETENVCGKQAVIRKKRMMPYHDAAVSDQKNRRFQYQEEQAVQPKEAAADVQNGRAASADKTANPSEHQKKDTVNQPVSRHPQRYRYEKTQQRAEKAQDKLEKAQRKLEKAHEKPEEIQGKPKKTQDGIPEGRHAGSVQRQYEHPSGRAKRRLCFETWESAESGKTQPEGHYGKAVMRSAAAAAMFQTHQKIRETEQDNPGVEAAHKAEFLTERGAGQILRWKKRRLREKPCRELRRAENHLAGARAAAAYQELLRDHPELEKKIFSKWVQKQKLKRKYAAALRQKTENAPQTADVLHEAGQAVRRLVQNTVARKTVCGILAVCILFFACFGSLFSSCSAMLTGIQSAVLAACYVAEDQEINQSELKYTELEADLQLDIRNTQQDFPGYDEYRFSIGEIGHNPYELMGYLSAVYDDFTYVQVEAELYRLFGLQYRLTREEKVEIRSAADDTGIRQEYEWHVLETTLAVRPLSEIIADNLLPGSQSDRYAACMQTCGGRQCYGSPFDCAWIPYVINACGYRIDPVTGAKELHQGIDIGMAEGTPVRAVQDGRVLSAGSCGDDGLCVVIEDENGYQSKYAHCFPVSVSAGQEVKRGDVIAAVGNTGSSQGSYLHLEVGRDGMDLNPYYYVDHGGSGYLLDGTAAGGPVIPDDPGAAMGDGSFAAMLAEAEKYLGFPYVWGGSSPATSFDCSGFVSWVVNHSGAGNVGRQTAQGLYNLCTPVSREELQPGDLVFFTGTYSSANPVTHVGIYVGGNRMIHCGSPISYADISGNYWVSHYYCGGRLPR